MILQYTKMYNKVMLVDESSLRRLTCKTVLEAAGYAVEAYKTIHSGIAAAQNCNGTPLVVVCQKDGIKDMRRVLNARELETGVMYGLIEMGIKPETALQGLWSRAKVPCGDVAPDLVSAVNVEYARIASPEMPKQYSQHLAAAVGF